MKTNSLFSKTRSIAVATVMLSATHVVSAGDFNHTTMTIGDQVWTSNILTQVTPLPCENSDPEPGRVSDNGKYCGGVNNACFGNDDTKCDVGRLFTLRTAKLVCDYVSDFNGGGWRLPTDSDWQKLVSAAGDAYPQSSGEQAFSVLAGDGTTFKAAFGGKTIYFLDTDSDSNNPTFTPGYYDFSLIGYYWADDPELADSNEGRIYTFRSTDKRVLREKGPKHDEYSVRCVKDAG